jgi:prephenate dehydratase
MLWLVGIEKFFLKGAKRRMTRVTALKVGYLGPEGSNSHQAVLTAKGHWHPLDAGFNDVAFHTLTHLLEAVATGLVDVAILPYENGLEGTVVDVLEFLGNPQHHAYVHAEFLQPIEHALLIQSPTHSTALHTIYSHQMALGQCKHGLRQRFGADVQLIPTASTAEAAQRLAQLSSEAAEGIGVLATAFASRLHQLTVLEPNVSDADHNVTRFFIVTGTTAWEERFPVFKQESAPLKTSLCVALHEYPGVLTEYLQVFQRYWVNLTKIESRPTREQYGDYRFYLDAEGDLANLADGRMWSELKARSRFFHAQGPYRCLG